MTDTAAALLAEIIAHPADDGLRLIYADWLEEQGDHTRAEFIRVQVELAKGRPEDTLVRGSSEWRKAHGTRLIEETEAALARSETREQALRRRERELDPLARERFMAQLVEGVPLPSPEGTALIQIAESAVFRRGFVASVACTLAAWLLHGPALVRAAPLESVRLTDREPHPVGDGRFVWDVESEYAPEAISQLPGWLFDSLLATCQYVDSDMVIPYKVLPTFAAAHADLSAACIQWAWTQEV